MDYLQILLLAIVQGLAELLPVSSSAHVILAEKLMGLDPTSAKMTFMLVMLHTGTMFAVIVYFWKSWQRTWFHSLAQFVEQAKPAFYATAATGVLGLALMKLIPKVMGIQDHFEIEQIFGNSRLIAGSLAVAGLLIFFSGWKTSSKNQPEEILADNATIAPADALRIGLIQGLCLPFRGFSRSGATISLSLLLHIPRRAAEEFSFALAVILTPAVVIRELWRLLKSGHHPPLSQWLTPSLLGMVMSFLAGLVALRWLSHWLERGKWHYFGIYCLLLSLTVASTLH